MQPHTAAWSTGWSNGVAGRPQHPRGSDLHECQCGYVAGAAKKIAADADRRGD